MSSSYVRTQLAAHLDANWTETPWFDLSDYLAKGDLPKPTGRTAAWVGVQYVGGTESLASVGSGPDYWREDGTIFLHVVVPSGFTSDYALGLCESLRAIMRGALLGRLYIESVDPPTDASGAAIKVDGPWHGYSMAADYTCDSSD